MNCSGRFLPDEIRSNHIFVRALRSEGTKVHAQPRSSRRSLNLGLLFVLVFRPWNESWKLKGLPDFHTLGRPPMSYIPLNH